jgi:hypothetical protein
VKDLGHQEKCLRCGGSGKEPNSAIYSENIWGVRKKVKEADNCPNCGGTGVVIVPDF